ncbi:MAG: DUF1189 family protein [Clostridia bacterium]|nr:DUF1189 family protein [Clostridia bacterium]
MEKNKKLNFFQKIILSIADFRFYPFVLKTEKLPRSFGHFVCFMMILVALMTWKYSVALFHNIDTFITKYDEVVPEFTLKDGILDISKKDTVMLENGTIAVIDTSNPFSDFLESDGYKNITRYNTRLFINSDAITYEMYDGTRTSFLLSNVELNFDKASFYEYISGVYHASSTKITIVLALYISIFIGYFTIKLIEVFLFAIFASLVSVLYRIRVEFKNYMKVALYIVTLPYIVEVISILVVGSIKDYAVFASNVLAYIYIFYAIRAIKLDAFLLIVNNKNLGKVNVVDLNKDAELKEKEEVSEETNDSKDHEDDTKNNDTKDDENKNGGQDV